MSVEYVSRKQVFKQNPVLARHIYEWQTNSYDPVENSYEAGEKVFLEIDDDEPAILTAKQAAELNKDYEDYCKKECDPFDPPPPEIGRGEFFIAELECQSFEEFIEKIGTRIEKVCHSMEWDRLLMISGSRIPYLAQENDYPPVERAKGKLISLGLEPEFTGALILQSPSVGEFFSQLFWIARCNAEAPYISFSAPGSAVVGTLCKYGNIHFDTYCEKENSRLLEAVKKNGFNVPDDGYCEEKFSETGALDGRRITVD